MTDEELNLLGSMYINAVSAAEGKGDYIDPEAEKKANVLLKAIDKLKDLDSNDEFVNNEVFIYKTKDRRDFMEALNASRMACALYDILNWNKAIYNGKDYGKGSVIYRNKLMSSDEWSRRTNSFGNESEITYDWEKKVYKDSEGEVPSDEVFFVYTRDQISEELDDLLRDVSDFIYQIME